MDEATISRLENSFNLVAPRAEELAERFYGLMFRTHPEVRALFPEDMASQRKKIVASLVLVVQSLRHPEKLREPLLELGRRHIAYQVKPEHYPVVRDALIETLSDMAGEQWSEQLTIDWRGALDFVASVMLEAHLPAAAGAVG